MMSKKLLMMGVSTLMVGALSAPVAFAQEDGVHDDDNIIVTGTRRSARSAIDTPAPVDVVKGTEFVNQGGGDISDLVAVAVPSYNVNTQSIADAATLVRPANLRGLSPDQTLVMVNSKRMHRASVIAFLGGGISDGAQGPDISNIPALAIKQLEVLRDGASTQYGSDAIAGVMNFILKDSSEGVTVQAKYGSTYQGDGDEWSVAANVGLPLGDKGFVNITGEWRNVDPTTRSVQRDDALALIAAGNTAVRQPAAQIWGQPQIDDDIKLFVNTAVEFSEHGELYAFGNYAQRRVEGGFFFRNPTNRGGVFAGPTVDPVTGAFDPNGVPSVLVGNLAGLDATACPAGIPLTAGGGLLPDPTVLGVVTADANCFAFTELFPGGFTPQFGGKMQDKSVTVGIRGDIPMGNGIAYDVSYSYGKNDSNFFISNTINASLGPNTPTSFAPGGYSQEENIINADFAYDVPIHGFASDLNIAAGFEFRSEAFTIRAGDPASFAIGPLSAPSIAFPNGQGFSSSSNGFGGFTPSSAGTNSQSSVAFYLQTEADVTDRLTLQGAVRYEDYTAFGTTTNYKVGALFKVTDSFRLRSTYSTGFHAPTAGQANVSNISTAFNGTALVDRGVVPLTSGAGQFMADFIVSQGGTRPTLGPENSDSVTLGAVWNFMGASITLDVFNINVENRVAISGNNDFIGALRTTATNNNVAFNATDSTSQLLNALDAAGVLSISDFAGSEDLLEFTFFSNDFNTRTTGADLVVNMPVDLGVGSTNAIWTVNVTDTQVKKNGTLGAGRIRQLEDNLPGWRSSFTVTHDQGRWGGLVRANYYGSYFEDHLDANLAFPIEAGAEITFDAQVSYDVNEAFEVAVGARNLLNNFPDENPFSGVVGARYPVTSPMGFAGGFYYVRLTGRM
ncbi:TonB-dependent receptor [hydrothermal vent metagenome]|uniref:TonB-dependent receptor n=1 Tax=hydrothermal vent metagenome TaxID=652676 RepID=A0A3B0RQ27_9ZZZZ